MNFSTASELLTLCRQKSITVPEAMLLREKTINGTEPEAVYQRLASAWSIMQEAAAEALRAPQKTMGGLIGGEAIKLDAQRRAGRNLCGQTVSRAVCCAMGVLEVSASMGLIVAAPTAGASGVLPGVLIAMQESYDLSDDILLRGLLTASAVGCLIAENAGISGAQGGCQAEVGTASAMAAAAAVEMMGGTAEQCFGAASIAIQNLLGLVCDPIAGLVEAPCQARNAVGASNALVSAEIALAGISSIVPFDEAVAAMQRVGRALPESLRETAQGGMAATPTGCSLAERLGCGGCVGCD